MADFGAQIDAWVQKSEARMLAVFKQSAQELSSLMQSRIPVDTGFARASHRASLTELPKVQPKTVKDAPGTTYPYDQTAVSAVIAKAKLGDKIFLGWTADYVEQLERGHSQQAPSGFIRLSVLEWPRIIKDVTERAKSRST
jgi:hypothetical protein